MLGEWGAAAPMLAVDATCMGLIGLEAAGRGAGRIDVFFTAVMLSAVFRAYAVSDGHRQRKRRRERMDRRGCAMKNRRHDIRKRLTRY